MIELQFINYILEKKDISIARLNAIDKSYFPNYTDEFEFIANHYDKYQQVCDVETFLRKFPEFNLLTVTESPASLVADIQEEHTYNTTVPIIQKAAALLKEDSTKAVSYLLSKSSELSTKLSFTATDLVHDADIRLLEFKEKIRARDKFFIATGLDELDKLIGGWDAQEELALISARTGVGKSWWLDYFLLSAIKQGKTVGLFSGEMSPSRVGYRVDTFFSNISNFSLTRGHQSVEAEYEKAIEAFKKLPGKFYVITPKDLGGYATVPKLRAFCERYNLDLLGVDQYSLMDDARGSRNRSERYENISMDMKLLQSEMRIPIIANVQLNRGVEKDVDPDTANITGSDRIGQDGTLILSITQKTDNRVELRIMKGRECERGAKLIYTWNIDTGTLQYIPCDDDATKGAGCEEVANKYKSNVEEDNPF